MSPAKKPGSAKIRDALLAGEALEARDTKRFGVTGGVLTIIVSELRGRGGEFETTDVPSTTPHGANRKRYRLRTPPSKLDMTIGAAEAIRRGRAQVEDKKAKTELAPAPPSLDVPAWGSLVKITGLIEGEDGELHIILRQNGHAWHCVVAGKAEAAG